MDEYCVNGWQDYLLKRFAFDKLYNTIDIVMRYHFTNANIDIHDDQCMKKQVEYFAPKTVKNWINLI